MLKQKVYNGFLQSINNRIELLSNGLNDLRESSKNETKSSAGDKYETTRAMLQLEQDKINVQLKDAQEQKATLGNININLVSSKIIKGSLVKTNKGYFFISLALGKLLIDSETVFAISPASPLGFKLTSLEVGVTVEINNVSYVIEAIL